jgi:hypothetical protein
MVQISGEMQQYPLLVFAPLAIIAYGMYKRFFPTESLYDDHPDAEQSLSAEGEKPSDAPSAALKDALGSDADELLQVEGRLLDQLANLGVTGPSLIETARRFSVTRSKLVKWKRKSRKKPTSGDTTHLHATDRK